jgi:hypothetical protein
MPATPGSSPPTRPTTTSCSDYLHHPDGACADRVEDDARTPDNEVSESRVSQLHTRAIQNLRSILSP